MNTATKKYLLELLETSELSDSLLDIKEDGDFPSYLYAKTAISIQKEISDVCIRENIPQNILDKLTEYRYVDKICDLIRGKHVRWVRLSTSTTNSLTKGGIVADIKFLENGIYILIKNARNQFMQYKFDDCITFQKLSTEELLYTRIC
jgi:hypothetical protein